MVLPLLVLNLTEAVFNFFYPDILMILVRSLSLNTDKLLDNIAAAIRKAGKRRPVWERPVFLSSESEEHVDGLLDIRVGKSF